MPTKHFAVTRIDVTESFVFCFVLFFKAPKRKPVVVVMTFLIKFLHLRFVLFQSIITLYDSNKKEMETSGKFGGGGRHPLGEKNM